MNNTSNPSKLARSQTHQYTKKATSDFKKTDQLDDENRQKGGGQKRKSKTSPVSRSGGARKAQNRSFLGNGLLAEEPPRRGLVKSQSMKKVVSDTKQKLLPSGFAQSVILQEFEIEKGGVELTQLLALYQSAVEYYDSIGDQVNSGLYRQKMTFVFMKPHISQLFLPPQATKAQGSKKSEKKKSPKISPKQQIQPRQTTASNEQSEELSTLQKSSSSSKEVKIKDSYIQQPVASVKDQFKPPAKQEDLQTSTQAIDVVKPVEPELEKREEREKRESSDRRGRSKSKRRMSSRPRSSELIKILQVPADLLVQENPATQAEVFDLPEYKYHQGVTASEPLQRTESSVQQQLEEQRLRDQLKDLQQREEKEELQKIIQSDLQKMQDRKREVSNLLKKDMREQSETIKQRLAMRSRRKHASMQRLDLSGVSLAGVGNTGSKKSGAKEIKIGASYTDKKGNSGLIKSTYIPKPQTDKSNEANQDIANTKLSKFIDINKFDKSKLPGYGDSGGKSNSTHFSRKQVSPQASDSIEITFKNQSASKASAQKSPRGPMKNQIEGINFSDLLDDVTYIPDPSASAGQDKALRIIQGSEEEKQSSAKQNLKKASYQKEGIDLGKQPSASSKSNSFDIVSGSITDAVSIEPGSSGAKTNGAGSGSKEHNSSSGLSEQIPSVVSESPVVTGDSHSFSISQASQSQSSSIQSNQVKQNSEAQEQAQRQVQYELEKSMVDMKYRQQLSALEKKGKPNNPMTKRLIQKVQNEWNQAIQKKKEEFNIDNGNEDSLDQLQVNIS